MRVTVVRRRGWSSIAACAVGLAALASACETESDGYVFDGDGESGDGGADSSSGGSKGGTTSGRGGDGTSQGGADATAKGGSAEGGSAEPTSEGGTAGSASAPPQAGEGGAAPSAGSGGSGGAGPEPTAGSGGDTGDTEPPSVVGTNPTDGASNVSEATSIRVQFSEPLDEASVTEDSFVVVVNGAAFPGELDVSEDVVTFTPGARLPLLAKVDVTLGAELTDLAGNALSDAPYEWGFELADGVWQTPTTALGPGVTPQTAIDAGGAVVGWVNPGGTSIWAAAYDASENEFETPVSLAIGASPSDFLMGGIGGGTALAVWIEYPRVRSSRFTPGSGWSSPVYIDGDGAETATTLALATNENGYAVAAWLSSDDGGASRSVVGNRFASNAWGGVATVDSSTALSFTRPAVSISDDGLAALICTRVDDQLDTVWASSRSGGSFSTPAPLESVLRKNPMASNELTSVSQRAIGVANDGRMLAVWTLYTSGIGANPPVETRFVRSSTNGSWGDFESFGDRRGGLWFAGNGRGEALAAFNYGASAELVPMRYTPTNGWSALTPFAGTSGANGGSYIGIGIDAAGNGLLVWDPLNFPRAARYVAGGAAAQWSSPPTELGESPSFNLSLSVSRKRGSGVAAWLQAPNNLHTRVFDFRN